MWYEPAPKRPFYCRAWFLIPAVLILMAALCAAGGFLYLAQKYVPIASSLDFNKLQDMETASIVYDRHGQQLGKIYIQNRDTVSLSEMSGNIVPALISAEDNRFWQHHGVDFIGIARAMLINWRSGRIRQGASTITQQLARNSFPDVLPPSDRSFSRKILEAFVAWQIENHLPKTKILECYLNRVYFGSGFFGIEAAARGYFDKPARDLTLSECATLAGMLRSPNKLSPWRDRKACIDMRDVILGRMLELDWINRSQYEAALAEHLAVKSRRDAIFGESYAVEFVRQQVTQLLGEDENVYGDGFRIYTTLDARLQKTAEESLKKRLEAVERRREFKHPTYSQYDVLFRNRRKRAENNPLPPPDYLQGALYALDNATGGVLALVGGRDFAHNQYNRALLASRPAGTEFLPIVYAAAFEKGIFPGSVWQDAPMDNRQVMIGGMTGILGEWGPESADNRYEGPITAHAALVKSKNAASVRLGMATGLDAVCALAKKARIDGKLRPFPSTYLGSSEVTLEDMTVAFTMFPELGERPKKPFIVTKVERKDGSLVFQQTSSQKVRVISPTTAWEIHSALTESLERGSADKAYTRYGLKREASLGGKTGTAYNFTDDWFIGYSSAVTCGVWTGFDTPTPIYLGAFSNDIAMPIWIDFMNATFGEFPAQPIQRPPGLQKYEICSVTGQLLSPKCVKTVNFGGESVERSTAITEWGTPAQAPKVVCELHTGVKHYESGDQPGEEPIPKPQPAWNPTDFTPVAPKSPVVTGADPFHAITHGTAPEPTPEPTPTQTKSDQVIRAKPAGVDAQQAAGPQDSIQLDAPAPIKF